MSNDLSTIDAPEDLKTSVAACVRWSQENVIATADDYAATAEHDKQLKRGIDRAKEFFDGTEENPGPVRVAKRLHEMLCRRRDLLVVPQQEAREIDKKKMLAYTAAEQAKAEAERKRLQSIADERARVERQAIEAAAAKQRAIEAEARAKAEQARQAAMQASEAERKRLLKEAEAAERKAEKAAAVVEAKQEAAAQVQAPVIAVQANVVKVAGQKTSTTWVHEITDLPKFLAWAAEAKRWDLLLPNEKMIAQYAKSMRENSRMDGVTFKEKQTLSSSSR